LHVDGYFEETKLPRIRLGDSAEVQLMGEERWLSGHVESIAGGIADRDRGASANLLADVNPTFNWVRLAQRVPVRIMLDKAPVDMRLIPGRTATVRIESANSAKVATAW
jgi:multidrug resistance efflux pump